MLRNSCGEALIFQWVTNHVTTFTLYIVIWAIKALRQLTILFSGLFSLSLLVGSSIWYLQWKVFPLSILILVCSFSPYKRNTNTNQYFTLFNNSPKPLHCFYIYASLLTITSNGFYGDHNARVRESSCEILLCFILSAVCVQCLSSFLLISQQVSFK